MIREYYQHVIDYHKHKVDNTCKIGVKLLYMFFNNYCLTRRCKHCVFRNVNNFCSIGNTPEEWEYHVSELEIRSYLLSAGYNYMMCSFKYSDLDALDYIGAIAFKCHTNVGNCADCEYKNKKHPDTSNCGIRYIRSLIYRLENDLYR